MIICNTFDFNLNKKITQTNTVIPNDSTYPYKQKSSSFFLFYIHSNIIHNVNLFMKIKLILYV